MGWKVLEFLYIDYERLNAYLAQLPPIETTKSTTKFTVTAPGFGGVERSGERAVSAQSDLGRIPELLEHLRDEEQLSAFRPLNASADDAEDEFSLYRGPSKPFVYESFSARKVIFPEVKPLPGGPAHVSVWVSDPDPEVVDRAIEGRKRPEDNWEILRGSFLYLIEAHFPNGGPRAISGTSALQMVVDLLGLKTPRDVFEPFGRGEFMHPIQKLERVGGFATDFRDITSLYLIRAVTNEQSAEYLGRQPRLCDVLGYPIFIQQG